MNSIYELAELEPDETLFNGFNEQLGVAEFHNILLLFYPFIMEYPRFRKREGIYSMDNEVFLKWKGKHLFKKPKTLLPALGFILSLQKPNTVSVQRMRENASVILKSIRDQILETKDQKLIKKISESISNLKRLETIQKKIKEFDINDIVWGILDTYIVMKSPTEVISIKTLYFHPFTLEIKEINWEGLDVKMIDPLNQLLIQSLMWTLFPPTGGITNFAMKTIHDLLHQTHVVHNNGEDVEGYTIL